MASPVAKFTRPGPTPLRVTLAINIRDCIGCEVCVAHCAKGVLKMVDDKALIDLRHVNECDLDGHCVEVCPTDVVTLLVQPAENDKSGPTLTP
jgi:ferredoxin